MNRTEGRSEQEIISDLQDAEIAARDVSNAMRRLAEIEREELAHELAALRDWEEEQEYRYGD